MDVLMAAIAGDFTDATDICNARGGTRIDREALPAARGTGTRFLI
jgi:hypothetical protein